MRLRLSIGLFVAGLALGACSDVDGAIGGGGGSAASVPEAELLSFEAETIEGDRVDVDDHAGSDLVIWFWAPW